MIKQVVILMGLIGSLSATEVALSYGGMKWDYLETAGGEKLDSEDSTFSGMKGGALEVRFGDDRNNDASTEISTLAIEYYSGTTNYIGQYISGGSYGDVKATTRDRLKEISFRQGQLQNIDHRWKAGFEVGAGYREWERWLADSNLETYRWPYLLVGVGAQFNLLYGQSIKAMADYKMAFSPKMSASGANVVFDLKDVKGYQVSVVYKAPITKTISAELSYKHDNWSIGASDPVNGMYEPDSSTDNDYVTAGVSVRF